MIPRVCNIKYYYKEFLYEHCVEFFHRLNGLFFVISSYMTFGGTAAWKIALPLIAWAIEQLAHDFSQYSSACSKIK